MMVAKISSCANVNECHAGEVSAEGQPALGISFKAKQRFGNPLQSIVASKLKHLLNENTCSLGPKKCFVKGQDKALWQKSKVSGSLHACSKGFTSHFPVIFS